MIPTHPETIAGHRKRAGHEPDGPVAFPSDLTKIIATWAKLPTSIRACVVTMIETVAAEK
jgi:hypothetical protein